MPTKPIRVFSIFLLAALLFTGCGSPQAQIQTTSQPSAAPASEPAVATEPQTPGSPSLSDTITLPDGWTMKQVISAEEVDAITGKTGYQNFPEGSSDPKNGKPAASFTHSDGTECRISFYAFTQGKQERYDYYKDFAVEDSIKEVDSPLWDSGHIADFTDGTSGITVLRGDNCMHIRWNHDAHTGHEKTEFGLLLAGMLIQNLYGGANG